MKKKSTLTAKAVLARKPDNEIVAKIAAFAESKGCTAVEYVVDESIIGGIILYIGDTVYGGSVKNRLEKIKQAVSE